MSGILFWQQAPTQFDAPLYRELVALGVDVEVWFGSSHAFDPEMGLDPDFGDLLSGYRHRTYQRFRPIPKSIRHVVVAGWSQMAAIALLSRARAARLSTGVRFDTEPSAGPRAKLRAARARLALSLATVGHPVGSRSVAYLESLRPAFRGAVVNIPYAIDASLFQPWAATRRGRETGAPCAAFRVLLVSKLNARENPLSVLTACAGLKGVEVVVVGDGPDRQKLEAFCSSNGCRAVFLGYRSYQDLGAIYAGADLFIHPARVEPWGVSVQEAMAVGLPVLASTAVGAADDLIGWADRVRFEPDDVAAIRAMIYRLQVDPIYRSGLSRRNEQRAGIVSPRKTAIEIVRLLGA